MEVAVPVETPGSKPVVELVIPCLNEAHVLEGSVETIRSFLQSEFPFPARIRVADNGSTDGTADVARRLSERHDDVEVTVIDRRGRGRALRQVWSASDADIMAYTDVDISTDLMALEKICRAIWEDGYDIAIGSRLMPASRVTRGFKREFISRAYNVFLKLVLRTHFTDAQCGFKAVSRRVAHELVPTIRDDAWFFDTELLTLAEKEGYRIKDVPVHWVDDDDSRVKIIPTAWEDIKGVFRVRWWLWKERGRVAALRRQKECTT